MREGHRDITSGKQGIVGGSGFGDKSYITKGVNAHIGGTGAIDWGVSAH